MEIIAHRGAWKYPEERNTLEVLINALKKGYGIETDIRDYNGRLVISHNVANADSLPAEKLFEFYSENRCEQTLALNVKADGIQPLLIPLLEQYKIRNYFLFDMSVPEMVVNDEKNLRYYTRRSDVEAECVLYDRASGVWLDSFYQEDWLPENLIEKFISDGKWVCIVSPELHGRDHESIWKTLKNTKLGGSDLLSICTDIPDEAKEYFYENEDKSNII